MKADKGFLLQIANSLKNQADRFFAFLKDNPSAGLSVDKYDDFWNLISDYYLPHLSVKYIVDYMSETEIEESFSILEEARVYAEPVFRDMENYVEQFADKLALKLSMDQKFILSSTGTEIRSYLSGQKLNQPEIEERFNGSAILANGENREIITGSKVSDLELELEATDNSEIVGQSAFKGVAIGEVKIIFNPATEAKKFNDGDILVTGMTRPEYVQLMKKAAAIITDAGGMLCHAAITARELKKPCVIGTKNATKVLKDGDTVEVDADKGTVRKI